MPVRSGPATAGDREPVRRPEPRPAGRRIGWLVAGTLAGLLAGFAVGLGRPRARWTAAAEASVPPT